MEACHAFLVVSLLLVVVVVVAVVGGESSRRRAEPHSCVVQMGASRSGAGGERERRAARLLDLRRLGCESWYLSGKRVDGRVR